MFLLGIQLWNFFSGFFGRASVNGMVLWVLLPLGRRLTPALQLVAGYLFTVHYLTEQWCEIVLWNLEGLFPYAAFFLCL